MIIYKCDRCGKEIERCDAWHIAVFPEKDIHTYTICDEEHYDVCEDCAVAVSEWMKEPKKIRVQTINRLNAFQQAFEEMKGEGSE